MCLILWEQHLGVANSCSVSKEHDVVFYIFNNEIYIGLEATVKECSNCELKPPPIKKKPPAELEAATSTTPTESPLSENQVPSLSKLPTQEWGIEEVIQFIESSDPCLGVHADLFRKHVSD